MAATGASNTIPITTKPMTMTTQALTHPHTHSRSISADFSSSHAPRNFCKPFRTPEQTIPSESRLGTEPPQGPPPETNFTDDESEMPSGKHDDCKPEVIITWNMDEIKSERGQETEVVDLVEETRILKASSGGVGQKNQNKAAYGGRGRWGKGF